MQERIAKGYEGDVGALWDVAQKQNAEAAALQRLDRLIDAQRRQVVYLDGGTESERPSGGEGKCAPGGRP